MSPEEKKGVATRIALIHATALAMAPIQTAFASHWPQAQCMNVLDDSLSADLAEVGSLRPQMVQRFVDLAHYAQRTGCQGILFTCSAFGPAIEAAAAATGLPTLKPNQAMFEEALDWCARKGAANATGQQATIGLIATFAASLPSMSQELLALAHARDQTIDLKTVWVPEAMQDLARGQDQLHHQKIAAASQTLRHRQVVMLAQFSMAAAQHAVQAVFDAGPQPAPRLLTSPDCAVKALLKRLSHD